MKLRVAGAQIPVTKDVQANVETITRAMDFAKAEKADVLLAPEGSLSGYYADFEPDVVAEALAHVTAKAKAAGLALALGTCYVEPDGKCYNQIRFYAGDGEYLGFHSKTLCCGPVDGSPGGEIERYAVAPLRTFELNGITIGGLICNDLWAMPSCTPMPDPHLTQQLSRMGARIIFHAVNGGRSDTPFSRETIWHYHQSNVLIRAKAGNLWIVVADNCHPTHLPCSVQSGVAGPEGTWALKTDPQGERFFVHTIAIEDAGRR